MINPDRPCPDCGAPLAKRHDTPEAWLFCEAKGGVLLGDTALREKLGDGLVDRTWAALTGGGAIGERRCPGCAERMRRLRVSDPSESVELDVCPSCRLLWFDPLDVSVVDRVKARSEAKRVRVFLDWWGTYDRADRIVVEAPPRDGDRESPTR